MNQKLLIGAWQILGWEITELNSDKRSFPFGEDPIGLIIYSEDGWMSAMVARREREKFSVGSRLREQADELLAGAYKSYFHYAGTYHLARDRVTHRVTMALNPNLVGTDQVRFYDFSDGVLTLRGEEACGSNIRYHTLRWQRVK